MGRVFSSLFAIRRHGGRPGGSGDSDCDSDGSKTRRQLTCDQMSPEQRRDLDNCSNEAVRSRVRYKSTGKKKPSQTKRRGKKKPSQTKRRRMIYQKAQQKSGRTPSKYLMMKAREEAVEDNTTRESTPFGVAEGCWLDDFEEDFREDSPMFPGMFGSLGHDEIYEPDCRTLSECSHVAVSLRQGDHPGLLPLFKPNHPATQGEHPGLLPLFKPNHPATQGDHPAPSGQLPLFKPNHPATQQLSHFKPNHPATASDSGAAQRRWQNEGDGPEEIRSHSV